jgi:hypothetical protein
MRTRRGLSGVKRKRARPYMFSKGHTTCSATCLNDLSRLTWSRLLLSR